MDWTLNPITSNQKLYLSITYFSFIISLMTECDCRVIMNLSTWPWLIPWTCLAWKPDRYSIRHSMFWARGNVHLQLKQQLKSSNLKPHHHHRTEPMVTCLSLGYWLQFRKFSDHWCYVIASLAAYISMKPNIPHCAR